MTGTSGDELSVDDARILALESGAIAGHTLKLLVLEAGVEPLRLDQLRELVANRIASEPRATERVEFPGDRPPRWIEDERFDVAAHVRERELDGGDQEALWKLAGTIMSERLDHSRPLWALDLVGPLDDGRQAIVARIHHAMADGISCMRVLDAVLWDAASKPGDRRASGASRVTGRGSSGHRRARELVEMPGAIWRELVGRASESPLDRTIGTARSLAFVNASLTELKRIGNALPGHVTVNDVLLAVVAGGLADWWRTSRGRLPHIRAQIPVSLHSRDHQGSEIGNRDSFLNIDLPIGEPDPLARLRRINAETAKRKRLGDAEELYDLFHALGRVGALDRAAGRLASGPREFSLSVSNVPGPHTAIRVADRGVELLGSAAEPAQRHALRVSALSCEDAITIGLCTDPEALPGVESLAAAFDDSLAELRAATID